MALVGLPTLGLTAMTHAQQQVSKEFLRRHVTTLGAEIGERNVWHPRQLEAAAEYVRSVWSGQGYTVENLAYTMNGRRYENLQVARAGSSLATEIVIVGAHYDSVIGSPGANDNGTGVAALLELSRVLAICDPQRTLRFVAFVNEEPPFFKTRDMGSRVYARIARERADHIHAMLSLETIGYYRDEPNTQHYPPLFRWFYPDTGNFIGFVGNLSSRRLLKQAVDAFRRTSDFPVESTAVPAIVPGIDWSDHGSFWHEGYPALMITDTALYRYPHYHSALDTPDKIDYSGLTRVTRGLVGVVNALASPGQI